MQKENKSSAKRPYRSIPKRQSLTYKKYINPLGII
jgi:hypothetical protein